MKHELYTFILFLFGATAIAQANSLKNTCTNFSGNWDGECQYFNNAGQLSMRQPYSLNVQQKGCESILLFDRVERELGRMYEDNEQTQYVTYRNTKLIHWDSPQQDYLRFEYLREEKATGNFPDPTYESRSIAFGTVKLIKGQLLWHLDDAFEVTRNGHYTHEKQNMECTFSRK